MCVCLLLWYINAWWGWGFLLLALKLWALGILAFRGFPLAFRFLRLLVLESWALKLSQGREDEVRVVLTNLGGLDDVEAPFEKPSWNFSLEKFWEFKRLSKVSFALWN